MVDVCLNGVVGSFAGSGFASNRSNGGLQVNFLSYLMPHAAVGIEHRSIGMAMNHAAVVVGGGGEAGLVGEEPHAGGDQRVDALLFSGNCRDAVGDLGGDGDRQTLERSIHAGAPRCGGSAESGKASGGQLPGVVCNLCCLGDNSVGHEGEQTVRTFEVDDNLFGVVFD